MPQANNNIIPVNPMPKIPEGSNTLYYIILAALLVVLVILAIQVIYVRLSLAKYSKEEYYKQLLVKNEYVSQQTKDMCSNFGVYALQIDTNLARSLNSGFVYNHAIDTIKIEPIHYTVPINSGYVTVEYRSHQVHYLPINTSVAATSRFINDYLANKIEYITWNANLFRIVYIPNFADQVKLLYETKHLQKHYFDGKDIFALIKIPTISELALYNSTLASSSNLSPVLKSFIGDSSGVFDATILPEAVHVIGYKV